MCDGMELEGRVEVTPNSSTGGGMKTDVPLPLRMSPQQASNRCNAIEVGGKVDADSLVAAAQIDLIDVLVHKMSSRVHIT
jgi:hypothetical protein